MGEAKSRVNSMIFFLGNWVNGVPFNNKKKRTQKEKDNEVGFGHFKFEKLLIGFK